MKRRIQGVAFVTALVTLMGLAVASYTGVFTEGVPVTLEVDRTGTQLAERADVKVRGLIVGEVAQITSDGGNATVELSLDPAMIDMIPADVSARLLPKTLFGEKYVSLVLPENGGGSSLAAGDVIGLDRTETARELDRALDGLLPLLQQVPPQDLATTLGALSQALSGRGEQLGNTLVQLQELTSGLRPGIPDLQEDITQLADFAGNLDEAAPDLLDAVEDLSVTTTTVVEQREELRALFTGLTTASDDLRGFLSRNRDNLIELAASARPTLESLARYSPEFPCLFGQLTDLVPRLDEVFGAGTDKPGVYVTLEIVNNKGKYIAEQDEPEYLDDRGPRCYPILDPGPQQPPDGPFCDGSVAPDPPPGTPMGGDVEAEFADQGADSFGTGTDNYTCTDGSGGNGSTRNNNAGEGLLGGLLPISYDGMGVANSPGERQIVAELVAAQSGTSPAAVPSWSSMMVGPLYRGTEVRFT